MLKKKEGTKEYAVVEAFNIQGGFGNKETDTIVAFLLDMEDVNFFMSKYIEEEGLHGQLLLNRYGRAACSGRQYCRIHKKKVVDLSGLRKRK